MNNITSRIDLNSRWDIVENVITFIIMSTNNSNSYQNSNNNN